MAGTLIQGLTFPKVIDGGTLKMELEGRRNHCG